MMYALLGTLLYAVSSIHSQLRTTIRALWQQKRLNYYNIDVVLSMLEVLFKESMFGHDL